MRQRPDGLRSEECVSIEPDGAERWVYAEVGLLGDIAEKVVGKTDGAFVAGVNQVAALEEGEVGAGGGRGGGLSDGREGNQQKE